MSSRSDAPDATLAWIVCIREVQKTLNQSAKALIESKIPEFGVGAATTA